MDWRYHLLKKTGYSFYTKETSGKTVELIGTSSVGKTTLFNKSLAKLKSRWFFAYHLEFLKRKAPPCEIDEVLMQILKRRIEKINKSDSFCPWHSLLDIQLSLRVMHETMLVAHTAYPKGFAFDEGLFRHFAAEILEMGDEFPVQLWKNRAFVYIRAQVPENVVSRVKSRAMRLAQIERQRSRTDDQILSKIVQDQEIFQSIVNNAIAFGCPVLVIDAENPVQDSINKILDFEGSLSQKFKIQEKMESITQPLTIN